MTRTSNKARNRVALRRRSMVHAPLRSLRRLAVRLGYYSRPTFVVIGAQKSGTTALHSILAQHSQISASDRKEIHYFDNDDWYSKKGSVHEYHEYFPLPHRSSRHVFESTPIYLYHPAVARRLQRYNPKLKLIALLRNPAERALSAWKMYHHTFRSGPYRHLHDPRSFGEAVREELRNLDSTDFYTDPIAYVKRGIYHEQLQAVLDRFPRDQVLVLQAKKLRLAFDATLTRTLDFLDVDPEPLEPKTENISPTDQQSHADVIGQLKEFYRPHNARLFEMIGERYDWD